MQALVTRTDLLDAFAMVSGVVPMRSPKPILRDLLLEVREGAGATLMATDLEVGIRFEVTGVTAERPGRAVLPTRRFEQILRTSTDDQLYLELEEDLLKVRGSTERSRFELATEDPEHFPEVPAFGAESYCQVVAADLKRLIRRTSFATDPDNARYAMAGVLFEVDLEANRLNLVSTDGRRLARASMDLENHGLDPLKGQPVVPVKALRLLERNLSDQSDEPPVHLAFANDGSALSVRTDRAEIYSRLVEGRFPNYRNVLPTEHRSKVSLEAGRLRNRIEQAAVVTGREEDQLTRGVAFHFEPGTLRLTSETPDVGQSQVEMAIDYEGPELTISFEPKFLLEALRVLSDETALEVELTDPTKPAVLRTEDDYLYLVMSLMPRGDVDPTT